MQVLEAFTVVGSDPEMILNYIYETYYWYSFFDCVFHRMFRFCFESIVAILLKLTLNKIFLHKLSSFFPKKNMVMNLDNIILILMLKDFLSRLDSATMKHFIITTKWLHHCL